MEDGALAVFYDPFYSIPYTSSFSYLSQMVVILKQLIIHCLHYDD